MSNIGRIVRLEIERIVKKEMKSSGAIAGLKDVARRMASLERAVASLEAQVKRAIASGHKSLHGGQPARRGRQFKATPETLKKLRAKLGITQGELAALLGVSGNAAWQWEADRARPRGKTLKAIQELGKAGKREVRRRLESM